MKKLFALSLVLLCLAGIAFTAEPNADMEEAKATVVNFIKARSNNDIELTMSYISPDYFIVFSDKIIDYEAFKSMMGERVNAETKVKRNRSINAINILKSEVKGNKAFVSVRVQLAIFNMDKLEESNNERAYLYYLIKKDNLWKILKIENRRLLD